MFEWQTPVLVSSALVSVALCSDQGSHILLMLGSTVRIGSAKLSIDDIRKNPSSYKTNYSHWRISYWYLTELFYWFKADFFTKHFTNFSQAM